MSMKIVKTIALALAVALIHSSAFAALSAKSYVREGLVAQFDGIENTSYGAAHDSSATQWKDLLSGGASYFTLSDGAAFAGGNGLSVVQTWRCMASDNTAIFNAMMSTNYTFEVAYNQTSATEYPEWTKTSSKRPKGVMLQFFHSYYWMGCDFNNSNGRMDAFVGFNPHGQQRGPGLNLIDYVTGAAGYSLGKHTLSCSQDAYDTFTNTACNISFDGVVRRTYTVDATVSANASRVNYGAWLNGNSSYSDSGINGIYHGIRAYNRPLTADEVAVNAAVDKVRFFGADASTITLPTGWRFAVVDSDVKLERLYTVSAANGTISIDDGAVSSSEAWIDYSKTTHKLTAVAAEGYGFLRWRGVETANPRSATIEGVAITGAVTAVFYKKGTHSLNSKSYIQDGIAMQLDGVENVTRGGAHVADSTVWNDLVSAGAMKFAITGEGASFAGGNALSVSRAWGCVSTGKRTEEVRTIYTTANFTVEVAYDQAESNPDSGDGSYSGYFRKMLEFGHPGYWVGIDWSSESKKDYAVGFSPYNHRREHHINTGVYGSHQMSLGKHVLSCVQSDADTTNVRFDHINSKDESFPTSSGNITWSGIKLNSGNFANSGMDGKYHSMRFYNRALTDDERAINTAVDQVRFFGADPEACTLLPPGYRFASEDTTDGVCLEKKCAIASNDGEKGEVAIGAGTAAASVDTWLDVADGNELTLTATAKDGYRFRRWTGAITGGDVNAATTTLTVNGAVTAEFVEHKPMTILFK